MAACNIAIQFHRYLWETPDQINKFHIGCITNGVGTKLLDDMYLTGNYFKDFFTQG